VATVLFWIFSVLQFLVAIGLIAIVAMQTTKSEGLAGTLGGKSSISFQGRPGVEEQLQQWTTYLAVAFIVLSFIIAVFQMRIL